MSTFLRFEHNRTAWVQNVWRYCQVTRKRHSIGFVYQRRSAFFLIISGPAGRHRGFMTVERIGGKDQFVGRGSEDVLYRYADGRRALTFTVQRFVRHTIYVDLRSRQGRQLRSCLLVYFLRPACPINVEDATCNCSVLTPRINSTHTLNHSSDRHFYRVFNFRTNSIIPIRGSFSKVAPIRANCNTRRHQFSYPISSSGNYRLAFFCHNVCLIRRQIFFMACKGVLWFCRTIVSLLHGAARAAVKVPGETMVTLVNGIGVLRVVSREDGVSTPREVIPNEEA